MTASGAANGDAFALPIGTVTFLLTDVEGSTLGWQAAPTLMGAAIARHYEILDVAVATHGGVRPQEQGEGDSIVGAFARASDALRAAVAAQHALVAEPWADGLREPIRVRMAIHTGEAQTRDEANYVGQAIIRTARLRAIAHGEQILVSQGARDLAVDQFGDEIEMVGLGLHRLKDLARPEHVWQVVSPGLRRAFPALRSLDAVPNNLPVDLSTFVGRQEEIASVVDLVRASRVVTLTGAGGAGKTRLAQHVAAQLADEWLDGAWWVELAPLDAGGVLAEVATVLRVNDPGALADRLSARELLVVLDNCEHVLDVVAPLVQSIVAKCPSVRVLATSRGPLDVPAEVTWRVPPLGVPNVAEAVTVERLAQFDAVHLFIDRARRARPNFELTSDNGPAVAELCARLDGIPLAIELAAARTKSLTPQQVLGGLDDAFRLLTGGSRLVMARQQTLEASIAWSHELLGAPERVLLRRLSVFAGGWDLEAAEAVCGGGELDAMGVLDALERLIDQSLVRVDENGSTARYQMLETVRQFAARQLDTTGESDTVVRAHTEWFRRFVLRPGADPYGPQEPLLIARFTAEMGNIASAFRELEADGDGDVLGDAVLAVVPFWNSVQQTRSGEAVLWLGKALAVDSGAPTARRARLLHASGEHGMHTGQPFVFWPDLQAAIEVGEAVSDVRTVAAARGILGMGIGLFDHSAGMEMLERALAEATSIQDDLAIVGVLYWQACLCWANAFDIRRATSILEDGEPLVKKVGSESISSAWVGCQAFVRSIAGDHAGVRTALAALPTTRLMPPGEVMRLQHEWQLAADLGEPGRTTRWFVDALLAFERGQNGLAITLMRELVADVLRQRDELEQWEALLEHTRQNALFPREASFSRFKQAQAHVIHGDVVAARSAFDDAHAQLVGTTNAWRDWTLYRLLAHTTEALIHRAEGDPVRAEEAVQSLLTVAVEQWFIRDALLALEMLAGLATARGSWVEAGRLAGAAQGQRDARQLHSRVEPFRSMLTNDLVAARAALGDDSFDAAFAEGRRLSFDDAVAYARRSRGDRGRPTIGWSALTPTERRVADLARLGRSNAEIGRELLMGIETVKTHLSSVYAKVGGANRTKLAALVPPAD